MRETARSLPLLTQQERAKIVKLSLLKPNAPSTEAISFGEWLLEATPSFQWHWRHLCRIRYYLASVDRGEIDRLAITVPPRHGKSEQVTVRRPAYRLESHPEHRFIVGAYNATLATKFSRRTRGIVRDRGVVALNRDRQAADDWETAQEGGVRAVGVSTGVTGHGADEIIIDDPVKSRAEANSQAYREACWNWYTDDLYTRLEPHGAITMIMTRWHEDDLMGRVLASEDGSRWTQCFLPAICESLPDELGRAIGEPLCAERYNIAHLERIQRVLGASWYALYQGSPTPEEGNIILSSWFRYYNRPEKKYLKRVQSWDCANKDGELHDWSVNTTWGVAASHYDLLAEYRDRVQFPALLAAAKQQAESHKPDAVLIEDKGNGTALIQQLRATTRIPVIAIEPVGSKTMRLSNESPAYESGLVRHPRAVDAPWIVPFEAELVSIPNALNDDRGDSVSQFLTWVKAGAGRSTVASAGRRRFN